MNRIETPDWFDDHQALVELSNNELVGSFPHLQPHVASIRDGYVQYVDGNGNPAVVPTVAIPPDVAAYLLGHYATPPSDIKYIKEIRKRGGVKTCPMCGSTFGGTLDHIFPKEDYPCFSIFGLNLVPACKCNSLRGTALLGANPGERVLHPYFDDVLGERLVAARFDEIGVVPKISVEILLDVGHPCFSAVCFHVKTILERTQMVDWLRQQWSDFVRKPVNVVRGLKPIPIDHNHLIEILQDELAILDDYYGSKNNWNSTFVAGLLGDAANTVWIFDQLNRPGRAPDSPLLEL